MIDLITRFLHKAGLSQPKTLIALVTDNQIGYCSKVMFVYHAGDNVWRSKTNSHWHLTLNNDEVNRIVSGRSDVSIMSGLYVVHVKDAKLKFWGVRH